MELTMTNNFGFCELNETEMMVTDGGIAIIPILIVAGITLSLSGCTAAGGGTNSNGVDYNRGTYNQHKKIGCNSDESYCGDRYSCPMA